MNRIRSEIDKSEYGYDDYLNYRIDDYWLDERLEELYPGNFYGGTVPTLLFRMEIPAEEKIVWQRIFPDKGLVTTCPILMCPDDNDFSCTLIVAKIECQEKTIIWRQIGLDQTNEIQPEKVGSNVMWFDNIGMLEFAKSNYHSMILEFKNQFKSDEERWKKRRTDQRY